MLGLLLRFPGHQAQGGCLHDSQDLLLHAWLLVPWLVKGFAGCLSAAAASGDAAAAMAADAAGPVCGCLQQLQALLLVHPI